MQVLQLDLARPLNDEVTFPALSDEALAGTALRAAFANKKATQAAASLHETKANAATIYKWLAESRDAVDIVLDYQARVEALEMVIDNGGSSGSHPNSHGERERSPAEDLIMDATVLYRGIAFRDWN
ncbi:hypothetical protein ETD86_13030 [Nonomuraea turkmeniaca]|uniref:Uncharacterized protein n=1 Tax=Nonomuraea turkmeniaca TaxID=103838 RepID=A0A5S4FN36_9ACTN|nr:hypothetical protein [Nonomuraea turkmeniaca]TMR22086.1 hypothetical protein ETD86_13030 [Nonomuraea turkmeniaca]